MKVILISFFIILTISCDTKQNQVDKDLKEIAKEVMISAQNCALITVDSLGVAHVRTMDAFLPEDDLTVWMGTNPNSLKVKQIQQNNKVSLYYFDAESVSYVTLQGTASIVKNSNKKEIYWKKEWENFYKNSTTDYILIKFTPNKGNLISEKYHILGDSITWETPQLNLK
jgi:general stress protein 26